MGGGKIIRDATALPGDVQTGKIFYNNRGRQIGTAKIAMETTKLYAKGYIPQTEWVDRYEKYIEINISSSNDICGVNLFGDYARISPKFEGEIKGRLIGITINGEYFEYPFPRGKYIQPANQYGYSVKTPILFFEYDNYSLRIEQNIDSFKFGTMYHITRNVAEGFPKDTVINFLSI